MYRRPVEADNGGLCRAVGNASCCPDGVVSFPNLYRYRVFVFARHQEDGNGMRYISTHRAGYLSYNGPGDVIET